MAKSVNLSEFLFLHLDLEKDNCNYSLEFFWWLNELMPSLDQKKRDGTNSLNHLIWSEVDKMYGLYSYPGWSPISPSLVTINSAFPGGTLNQLHSQFGAQQSLIRGCCIPAWVRCGPTASQLSDISVFHSVGQNCSHVTQSLGN